MYVSAYSVPGIGEPIIDKHALELEAVEKMEAVMPGVADVFIIVGAISGVILTYLLASRIIPVVNVWEQRELLLYRFHKRLHKTEVMVLGKKD
jgi:hypothetical protein